MKKGIVLLIGVFLIASGFKFSFSKDDKVILRVGESKITLKELNEKVESLPPQYQEYYKTQEGKKQLIDNLKKEFLIYEMSREQGYADNEEVLEQLVELKKQVMIAIYLKDHVDEKSEVTDREVKQYYKDNKEEFKSREQVKAKHILVKTEQEAQEIVSKLEKGEDFGLLAKEYSIDPSGKTNNGDLGWFSKGQMVKPFETAAFALDKGKYTKTPVQTQYGYHIILVEDKKDAEELDFKDVQEDIKAYLTQKKQKELLEKLLTEAESKITVEDHTEQLLLKD